MTHFWSRSLEGELEIDHRASPGLTEDQARGAGYGGQLQFLGEGRVAHYKSLRCCHCGGCWIENPWRAHSRHSCIKCSREYLCDGCYAVSCEPGYVHRSAEELRDMIGSGKWRCVGGTASKPLLVPGSDP